MDGSVCDRKLTREKGMGRSPEGKVTAGGGNVGVDGKLKQEEKSFTWGRLKGG